MKCINDRISAYGKTGLLLTRDIEAVDLNVAISSTNDRLQKPSLVDGGPTEIKLTIDPWHM